MTRTGLNWPFWMHILVGRIKLKNWGLKNPCLSPWTVPRLSQLLPSLFDPPTFFQSGFQHHLNHSHAKIGAPQVATVVKNPPTNAGNIRDEGLIPGSGRSPGEGDGNPLQYSCLENPMDREVWRTTVHRVSKSRTRLRDFIFTFTFMTRRVGSWRGIEDKFTG